MSTDRGFPMRTIPFWSGICGCGFVSRFTCPSYGIMEPGTVLDHLTCARCGAKFIFCNQYKHTDEPSTYPNHHGERTLAFHFVQVARLEDLEGSLSPNLLGKSYRQMLLESLREEGRYR